MYQQKGLSNSLKLMFSMFVKKVFIHNNNDKVSRHSCLVQVHWFSTLTLVSLETQDECFLGIVDTGLGLGALDTWTVHH